MPGISHLKTKASLVPDSKVLDGTTTSPADVDSKSLLSSITTVVSILILGVDIMRGRPQSRWIYYWYIHTKLRSSSLHAKWCDFVAHRNVVLKIYDG